MAHAKGAEAGNRHPLAARKARLYARHKRVQRAWRLRARQARIHRHFADQVSLIHEARPMPATFIKAPRRCQSRIPEVSGRNRTICYTAVSGKRMDQTTVRLIAGILAVVLVAVIFMRRKKKKGAADDDF
jgi:hypothetical protein